MAATKPVSARSSLICAWYVLVVSAVTVTGCRDVPIAPANIDNRTVYVNPDDSMLYSFSLDSGEQYTYYGHRDEAGLATFITLLDYIDAEGEAYTIVYDEMGLPSMVNNEEGATLVFDYDLKEAPEAQAAGRTVGQSAADGLMQIDSIGVTIQTVSDGIPSEVRTVISPDEPVVVYRNQNIAEMRAAEPAGTVAVNIDKCGEPADPPRGSVKVGVRRLAHHAPRYYPAYPTSLPGRFVSNVPHRTPETLPANTEAVCASFADVLSSFCSVYGPLTEALSLDDPAFQALFCLKLTAAVSLAALPAGATAGELCSVLLPVGTAACKTLGWSPKGVPQNLMQKLCGDLGDALRSIDAGSGLDTVLLQASVDFSAGSPIPFIGDPDDKSWVFTSRELTASAYAQYPDLDISATEPAIDQCTTTPGAPKAGQGYVASASLSCVAGMDISLSVTRDGVPLAQTTIRGDRDTQTVSLNVPGLPEGQEDVLVVTAAYTPGGNPVARKEITVLLDQNTADQDPPVVDTTVFFPCPAMFPTREEGMWPLAEDFEMWNSPPFYRYLCRYARPEGANPWTGEQRSFAIAWCSEPSSTYVGCGVPPDNPGEDLASATHKAFVSTSTMYREPLVYQEDVYAFREVLLKIVEDGIDAETRRSVKPAGAVRCE